jgi:hypothetical protein
LANAGDKDAFPRARLDVATATQQEQRAFKQVTSAEATFSTILRD